MLFVGLGLLSRFAGRRFWPPTKQAQPLFRRQVVEKSEHVAEMKVRLSLFGIRFSQVRNTDIRSANSALSKQ
jgi:hypothetical protein